MTTLRFFTALTLGLSLLSVPALPATPPKSILLWPSGAPGALGETDADKPALDLYLPAPPASGAAVLVVPGGGYQFLALDHEGSQIAHWLNDRGVAAFVLHYRLAPRYHYPAPILDGERAMRYIRAHASEFNLRPDRIGIWGFSAGGHLAASVTTHFDHGLPDAPDPLDRVGDRPDFAILAYGVLSMQAPITHPGSRLNLLGPNPDPTLVTQFSNESQITRDTPPCFLFHTGNDPVVPVENSLRFYTALLLAGVPAELHIFEQGDHGVGLAGKNPQLRQWPVLLEGWMRLHGWINPAQDPVPASTP
jgi:acetyl esterase/lipase